MPSRLQSVCQALDRSEGGAKRASAVEARALRALLRAQRHGRCERARRDQAVRVRLCRARSLRIVTYPLPTAIQPLPFQA